MTLLTLPYRYNAKVLPGPKFRLVRSTTLRAEAFVEVADLPRDDMEAVIRLPSAGRFREWRHPVQGPHWIYRRRGGDGRLFAPMLVRGLPVRLETLDEAIREPDDHPTEWWPRSRRSDLMQYPTSNSRHRSVWFNALRRPTLATRARLYGWPAPRIVSSDRDHQEGEAIAYLSESILLVDGEIWAECQEPVWMVRHIEKRNFELAVMRQPWLLCSHDCFRLDQRERALEYAERRKRALPPERLAVPVDVLVPEALDRDDIAELASASLAAWPEFARWFPGLYFSDETPVAELRRVKAIGGPPHWEIPTVMDYAAELAARYKKRIDWHTDRYAKLGAFYEGVRRWQFERPDLDLSAYDPLTEDDKVALEGLELF